MKKKTWSVLLSALLAAVIALNFTGCEMTAQAESLMESITPGRVTGKVSDEAFLVSQADFAVKLFQQTSAGDGSTLVSPLSMMLALSMTANGAQGQTKTEMETVLGCDIPLEDLNEYLYQYIQVLSGGEDSGLHIANSIWFRDEEDRLTVEKDFLQKNADYYKADAFKTPFNDNTLKEINQWTSDNTDGMVDEILQEIDSESMLYLINTLAFHAEWSTPYTKINLAKGAFTTISGEEKTVDMMTSTEGRYLDDGQATGFLKSYKNGYSFAALLPNEGVDIHDYIASLTGETLYSIIQNERAETVICKLPKFQYDCSIEMNDALTAMGMPTAFDGENADFSAMATSVDGNICIGDVLHKTFISVGEKGTEAGAATVVEMDSRSAAPSEIYEVTLDRPFVYMIVDDTYGLPVFIGTVMDI